jgi:hypothetical protein
MKIIAHAWRSYKSKLVKTRTPLSVSTKMWQKKTRRDLLKSVNQCTLLWSVSTCSVFDQRMSLTTTSATPVMMENRESGNKKMKDWPSKVLRIYTTNYMDG